MYSLHYRKGNKEVLIPDFSEIPYMNELSRSKSNLTATFCLNQSLVFKPESKPEHYCRVT